MPGQLIVRFKPGTSSTERATARQQENAREIRSMLLPRMHLVELAPGRSETAAARAFEQNPDVQYAEPNYLREVYSTDPNDTFFQQEWGLKNTGQSVNGTSGTADADIDAPEAWDITRGSAAVTVGVVDTGVAYNHPDLAANIWSNPGETGGGKETNGLDDDGNVKIDDFRGWDFVGNDNNPIDEQGHGTHVSGTIGAVGNNGAGVAGVNWNVRVAPLRACSPNHLFSASCTDAAVLNAFVYAGQKGFKVVNGSFGGPTFSQAYVNVISAFPDTMFVFAAGNAGSDNDVAPDYPCNINLPNVICVAATDQNDALASFSNYGATSVDLAAPGTNIASTYPFDYPMIDAFTGGDFSTRWTIVGTNPDWSQLAQSCDPTPICFPAMQARNPSSFGSSSSARRTSASSLAGMSQCRLQYVLKRPLLTNGTFLVEASTDAVNWTTLHTWTGTAANYVAVEDSLSAFDGQPNVYIRFTLTSIVNTENVQVALLGIRCIRQTYAGDEYTYDSGTSMASPHVAGAAGLLWASGPGATVAQVRNALLGTVDLKPSLSGKTVTGGRLNLAGAVARLAPYARPGSATPVRIPLVLAYNQCTAPNTTHAPPRFIPGPGSADPACSPPVRTSNALTTSANGLASGFVKLKAISGNPATQADEADVSVGARATDVRCVSVPGCVGGNDYSGQLMLRLSMRLTDSNSDSGHATVQNTKIDVPFSCSTTPGAAGSICSVTTTLDSVVAGSAPEGELTIYDLPSIQVLDAGVDGTLGTQPCSPNCGNGDERTFVTEGLFTP